jgi:metal-responsive CopG/Arc/MetJ family transcriptional regulator
MKPIQVMFDEDLLAELDADPVVRDKGRSAVMREAVAEYLEARKRERIAEAYERAYAETREIDEELEGWEDEGEWPKD